MLVINNGNHIWKVQLKKCLLFEAHSDNLKFLAVSVFYVSTVYRCSIN